MQHYFIYLLKKETLNEGRGFSELEHEHEVPHSIIKSV